MTPSVDEELPYVLTLVVIVVVVRGELTNALSIRESDWIY